MRLSHGICDSSPSENLVIHCWLDSSHASGDLVGNDHKLSSHALQSKTLLCYELAEPALSAYHLFPSLVTEILPDRLNGTALRFST